ncbi:MAG TPA: endonuclease III [Acidimicrobiia bacterium]|jgi:endonuclease-3|nr:endonuclease III [Acidimicrobiia bacterium]
MARPRGARTRADAIVALLKAMYPEAKCALNHANAYELLVATILSAQSTDERVNIVTPAVFEKYPTPRDLAHADPGELESLVQSTGFFRSKSKNLIGMAQAVDDRYDGRVPVALDDLVTLPGVGRKTGNVVRSVWFNEPGLPVDTHVTRLSRRLGLTNESDAVKIEYDLNELVAPEERGDFSLRLIEHGRRVCDARRPRCDECFLAEICPSAFKVGPWAKPANKAEAKKAAAKKTKKSKATSRTSKPQPI